MRQCLRLFESDNWPKSCCVLRYGHDGDHCSFMMTYSSGKPHPVGDGFLQMRWSVFVAQWPGITAFALIGKE